MAQTHGLQDPSTLLALIKRCVVFRTNTNLDLSRYFTRPVENTMLLPGTLLHTIARPTPMAVKPLASGAVFFQMAPLMHSEELFHM